MLRDAFEVGRDARARLAALGGGGSGRGSDDGARGAHVRACWWDPHAEEFEERTMTPATAGGEFAYARTAAGAFVHAAALRHFGLSDEDMAARAADYARVEGEREAKARVAMSPPLGRSEFS